MRHRITAAAFAVAMAAAPGPGWASGAGVPPRTSARETLAAIVGDAPGALGVSVSCGSAPAIGAQEHLRVRAASTLKVGIALAVIAAEPVAATRWRADPVLAAMLVQSDNAAANALLQRAGDGSTAAGTARVNRIFAGIGMTATVLDGPYRSGPGPSGKWTTPADLRRLADALAVLAATGTGPLGGVGVSGAQARVMLDLMARGTHRSLLATAAGRVAHKSGWLDTVENDLAVVAGVSGGPCAVGIVSDGAGVAAAQAVGDGVARRVLPLLRVAAHRPATAPDPATAAAAVTSAAGSAAVALPAGGIAWPRLVAVVTAVVAAVGMGVRQVRITARHRRRRRRMSARRAG